MLFEIPILRHNRRKDEWQDDFLFINPAQISSVERDTEDKRCCLLIMQNGNEYYVKMTKEKFRDAVRNYLKENVLQQVYGSHAGN